MICIRKFSSVVSVNIIWQCKNMTCQKGMDMSLAIGEEVKQGECGRKFRVKDLVKRAEVDATFHNDEGKDIMKLSVDMTLGYILVENMECEEVVDINIDLEQFLYYF